MKGLSSREIIQILNADGWVIKNQEGSHVQMVHPTKPGKVTIPHPRKDLPERTIRSILKQAALK
ncbi:MAG: type II toxin-antitoxin system HicA family toxin [Firmicutes bacterium]|nr:type II toxin-antitoxin system HicA family toxin [Bacillota bacterium]